MGKKKKKKGGNAAKSKARKATSQKNTTTKPKLDSDQTSLYRIYKSCTEAVIQWGKSTYQKEQSRKTPKTSFGKASLSHVIFDILGSLANDGTLMPGPVLRDLKLAISYRKRVRKFYQTLPEVSEEDYARHEWLIQQLEQLSRAFGQNQKHSGEEERCAVKDKTKGDQQEESAIGKGFEALALSDDEESLASMEADEAAESLRAQKTITFETPPTPQELEREERQYAISLFMYEIDSIRNNVRERWRKWAQQATENDAISAQNLFAITSSTEYALSAAKKSLLQMSMEIDRFPDIDQLIVLIGDASSDYQNEQLTQKDFKEGDLVTIHSLEKRTDINGKHGYISSPVDPTGDRMAVQLFPADAYLVPNKDQTKISIKPGNLLLSDNIFLRLYQIHSTMRSLNLEHVDRPVAPQMTYGAPTSTSVQKFGVELIMQGHRFEKAASKSNFQAFLELTVQYLLPLWLSLARYLPDMGAAGAVFNSYIRDYSSDGKLRFPLVFALLVAIDSAMVCTRANDSLAEDTKNLFIQVLRQAFTSKTYTPAIRLLQRDGKKANALYSHFEFTRHICDEYSVAAMFFPLVSGELMLTGLRMHFVCGSGLPYAYVEQYTNILHIYWVLRSEGYLGKIPELESVIGLYKQRVFFRGGLAKKGQVAYLKCQQLAHGLSAQGMSYLDGKAIAKKTGRGPFNPDALGRDGLHVSEISRLLDVLQWKTMPIIDKDACFNDIEKIAREEYSTIFTAPILNVSVKLSELVRILKSSMLQEAQESGERIMDNFCLHTSGMTPIDLISFWVMALGDDRSVVPGEKEDVLKLLSRQFASIFPGETYPCNPDEEATIAFSLNEHEVDPSFWGEKGVRKVEN